jgi:hypothetical protein
MAIEVACTVQIEEVDGESVPYDDRARHVAHVRSHAARGHVVLELDARRYTLRTHELLAAIQNAGNTAVGAL